MRLKAVHRLAGLTVVTILLLASGPTTAPAPQAGDERSEPPLEVRLTLDGKTHDLHVGQDFELTIKGAKVRGRLELAATRTLRLKELEFQYPQYYSFEYEQLEAGAQWTFDGNAHVLILTRLPATEPEAALRDTLAALPASWQRAAEAGRPAARRLDGRELRGRRFTVEVVEGVSVRHELLLCPVGSATLLIWSQETLDMSEEGKPHAESDATWKLIEKSARWR